MATTSVRGPAEEHPLAVTGVLSIVGYALVGAAFAGAIPIPQLGDGTVHLLSDLIAVVNATALVTLLAGYWFIKRGQVSKHRAAMLAAFGLILLFLVLYVTKVGGGFEKSIVIGDGQFLAAYAGIIRPAYLVMLAVHVVLSIVAVPVVLYAVVLGLTRPQGELAGTAHPRVGRIAIAAWALSLALGVITYVLLNHVYGWVPMERSFLLLLCGLRGRR